MLGVSVFRLRSSHLMPGLMLRPSTYHPIGSLDNNFRTAGLQNGPQFQGFEVPGTVGWGHIAARRYFALGPQPTDTWRKSAPRLLLIFYFSTFCNCLCRYMPMDTKKEKDTQCNRYRGVRFPLASSKNGLRVHEEQQIGVLFTPFLQLLLLQALRPAELSKFSHNSRPLISPPAAPTILLCPLAK